MKPPPRIEPGLGQRLAPWLLGAWLAVVVVKFGNPVIFSRLIAPPGNFFELFFNSWPIAWGYAALAILILTAVLLGREPVPAPRWLFILPLGWLGWAFLSGTQTAAEDRHLTRLVLAHFTGCVACLWVGALALPRVRDWRPVWWGLVAGLAFVIITALDQHFGGLERTRQTFEQLPPEVRARLDTPEFRKKITSPRVFGTFVYPNALAGCLLLLLPLTLVGVGDVSARPVVRRLLCAGLTLGGAGALYWSGSKSGWLIALAMAALALWQWPAKFSLKATVVGCLVVVGAALFLGRYGSYFGQGASSLAARLDYWRAAGQMIQQRPLLGYGPGTFQRQYSTLKPPEAEMARLAHNDYLQQGADSGVPAMVAYGAFVAGALLLTYRRSTLTNQRFAAWAGAFGFAAQGMSEFGLYIPALAWPFFLILGRLLALPPNEIDKPPQPF